MLRPQPGPDFGSASKSLPDFVIIMLDVRGSNAPHIRPIGPASCT